MYDKNDMFQIITATLKDLENLDKMRHLINSMISQEILMDGRIIWTKEAIIL